MKITFDSAILWLLPYLYLVSVMYYWGFWGTFDIDAFNYYAVGDLVKGVTAPIGPTLLYVLGIALCLVLVVMFFRTPDTPQAALAVIIFVPVSIAFSYYAYRTVDIFPHYSFANAFTNINLTSSLEAKRQAGLLQKTTSPFYANNPFLLLSTFVYVASTLVASMTALSSSKSEASLRTNLLRFFGILFIILMPGQAFTTGKGRAIIVKNNRAFDHVVADSLVYPKGVYKYLGKAGEYQILLTLDNLKRIIVPTSKLNPLVLESFSLDDSASVQRFNVLQKQLAARIAAPTALLIEAKSTRPVLPDTSITSIP